MPKIITDYNYINVCKGDRPNSRTIQCYNSDFFIAGQYVIVKVVGDRMTFTKPDIDHRGKATKMSTHYNGVSFSITSEIPHGKHPFVLEECSEDVIVIELTR